MGTLAITTFGWGKATFPATSSEVWLQEGKVKEMILVMPNAHNKLRGSLYTNSGTTGNWADYIAKDLVEYIDSHYRTLSPRESRAVIGHSMGGLGAIKLGLLYPEVFSGLGGMSGVYDFGESGIQTYSSYYANASTIEDWEEFRYQHWSKQWFLAVCAAFVPDPDRPPFYCDFPFVYTKTEPIEMVKKTEAYEKLTEHDILGMVESNRDALGKMGAIYIDIGSYDEDILDSRKLHEKLDGLGIEHVYNEFSGGHIGRVMIQTGDALEVLSRALKF
jgi:S-formylglutathione hydrolase FrmB